MEIVFDTYAWIEYFKATKEGEIVSNYLESHDILTPVVVLLELNYKSEKEGWNFKEYYEFIKQNSRIIGINEEFVFTFGKFYNKIKKQVKKIGITDVIILHTAIMHNAKVLTGDPHFSKMKESIMLC